MSASESLSPASAWQTLRFGRADFSGPDRIEAFRETYGRALLQLEIDPLPGVPFELDFTVRSVPGFGIAWGRLSPTRNRHTTAMIADDDVVLVHTPQGHGTLRQDGREVSIQSGEATWISNGLAGEFLGDMPSRLCNFRFSRARLAPLVGGIDDALVRKVDRGHPALRLLVGYAGVMDDAQALATPQLCEAVTQHMHELAALLLGATRDGAEAARHGGLRAARLRAVQADIAAHLTERELSIDTVAARQRVSPRTLRALFQAEGTTFAHYVLQQRLAHVHRQLAHPQRAGRPIGALAYEAGFGDLSYFNHAFRSRYGATPSDVRAAASGAR